MCQVYSLIWKIQVTLGTRVAIPFPPQHHCFSKYHQTPIVYSGCGRRARATFFTLRIGIKFAVKTKEGEGRALSEVNKDKSFAWMLAWTKTIASKLFTPLERISHPWHTFQWHEGWIPFLQKMPKKGTQYIRCSIEWFVHHLFPLVSLLQQLVDRQNIGKSEPYLLCQASRRQAADGPSVRAYGAYLQYWCITSATNECGILQLWEHLLLLMT